MTPKNDAEIRALTLAAFGKGGSVFIDGKFVSTQKDLPTDHPARWDEGEGPAQKAGDDDALMLSRVVELEAHLNAAYAQHDALEATLDQTNLALEAVKRERDKLAQQFLGYSAPNDAPPAPAFDAPTQTIKNPPATDDQPTTSLTTDAPGTDPELTAPAAPLPADFPKRDALIAAGLETVEAVRSLSVEEIAGVKGLSATTAPAVKAAAEA